MTNVLGRKMIISSQNKNTIDAIEQTINWCMPVKGERVSVESLLPNLFSNSYSLVFKMNPLETAFIEANVPAVAKGIATDLGDITLSIESIDIRSM